MDGTSDTRIRLERIRRPFKDPPIASASRRAAASPRGHPPSDRIWLVFLTIFTAAYLTVELAFNARLLDVASGLASRAEIDRVEVFGRFISGTALALALWGFVLRRIGKKLGWSGRKTIAAGIAIGVASLLIAYHGERDLIDTIVDKTTPEQRQSAVRMQLIANALIGGDLKIDGMDLDPGEMDQPSAKAFIALMPILGLSTEGLLPKTDGAIEAILRRRLEREMGNPERFYNNAYLPSVQNVTESYNRYVDGVNALGRKLAASPKEQVASWKRYLSSLRKHGWSSPSAVPGNMAERVRKSLRGEGIDIPKGWRLDDQQGFYAAVDRGIRKSAERAFQIAAGKELGTDAKVRTDLSIGAFVSQPAVQKRWKAALGIPGVKATISLGMSPKQVAERIWKPLIERGVAEARGRYVLRAEALADGAEHEEIGREAMRGVVVPPVALGFSLLGGLLHILKLTHVLLGLIGELLRRRIRWALPALAVMALILAVAPFLARNEVMATRLYGYFHERTRGELGLPIATTVDWIVRLQPMAYPLNDFMREQILLGYGFGYTESLGAPSSFD